MSGLVAVIAHQEAAVEDEDVEGLAESYANLRREGSRASFRGGKRIAVVLFGPSRGSASRTEADGKSWAVTVGAPRHREPLTRAPLDELDGAFGLIRYDADSDTALVASDPFGMQCLYTATNRGRTYVSTSALALAKHVAAKPSVLGVCTYLRIGMNCGPETHWDGIERLEPATCVRFSSGAVQMSSYWRPLIDRAVSRLSVRQAAGQCIEALTEVLRASKPPHPPAWADLTGGFDSRILALSLRRAGLPFVANTSGEPEDTDVAIAERISTLGGWEWHRFGLPQTWEQIMPARLDEALAWGDGLLDVAQLARVLWNHEQKAAAHDSLFIGGGGEHLRNFAWQQEFLAAGRSREVNWRNWLGMRLLSPMDTSIFGKDPTSAVYSALKQRMEAWIAPYDDELNTVKLDMLYAYKSTGHFGSYRSAAAAFLDAELPFYSKPVFVAATSSSFRLRNHHRLARQIASTLDAQIASVETATGGPAEPWKPTNIHRFAPYYARIGQRAANKIAQRAVGRSLFKTGATASGRNPESLLAALAHLDATGGTRYEDLRLGALLERGRYAELVRGVREHEAVDSVLFGRIVTAELAVRASDGVVEPSA